EISDVEQRPRHAPAAGLRRQLRHRPRLHPSRVRISLQRRKCDSRHSARRTPSINKYDIDTEREAATPLFFYWHLYTSVFTYLSPESTISVTTFVPGPRRRPTSIAAMTLAPDDVPANNASSRARRRAISFASSVLTAMTSSKS